MSIFIGIDKPRPPTMAIDESTGTEVDVACSGAWSTEVRWRPYMGATLEAAEAAQEETKGFRKFHVFWAWAWFFWGFNFFVSVMDLGRFGPL
ncbi:hypothetical protein ES288_A05G310000v1 [Gossypium darwinii]|uniref:Uncharacterized protein n=1 Tax=Gossypium darwinii TaxID=34276 RepID=A0A5D2GLE6_GOSDA|nr:hypothetical protein ES288_A05G310000v1 [Gossypium darwinii]